MGSLEHFLLERYYLFTVDAGRVWKGQVNHLPYAAHSARLHRLEDDLMRAAGLPEVTGEPAAVHYSPGVDVEVFGPWAVAEPIELTERAHET